jgi:MFS family permease
MAFRDFRLLWLSSVAQTVTMQMRTLIVGVWLFETTGSGLQLGLLGIVQLAVQLPAILYGGTLADQVNRKKLMSLTQSVSFALITALTVLVATGNLVPWHIYAVTAILGVASVLGGPARSALTANVVPRTHLMHAITLNTATNQVGSVIAPLLFAAVITTFGYTTTFAITAATAIPGVVLPLLIKAPGIPADRSTGVPMIQRMWEGFLYVKAHPILPGLYLLDIGVTIFSFYRQVLPLLVDRLFRAGPGAVGVLSAANSFGGITGTFAVLMLSSYRTKGKLVLYGTLAYAVLLVLFGLSNALWMGIIIIAGLGATDAFSMTSRQTTVQLTTPDNMRGRAVSFHSVSAMTANNIGTFEVGFMSQVIGAGNTMILGGAVGVVVVLLVWKFMRGVREYRYP